MVTLRMVAWCVAAAGIGAGLVSGCDQKATPNAAAPATTPAILPAGLFLGGAPAEAKDIKDSKGSLKAGDKVVLRGKIGGSTEPFVAGRAMFTIVDTHMKSCDQTEEMPGCKTPWDYCCDDPSDIAANAATVRVEDTGGQVLKTGLDGVNGLKPLATVTVVGTVAQADGPNLVVRAEGIFVNK